MPFNASGVYSLPAGPRPTAGQTALASQVTGPDDDIAAALSQVLVRDGRAPMTGALTLFADATAALHAVPKQQLDAAVAGKADASFSHAVASPAIVPVTTLFARNPRLDDFAVSFDLTGANSELSTLIKAINYCAPRGEVLTLPPEGMAAIDGEVPMPPGTHIRGHAKQSGPDDIDANGRSFKFKQTTASRMFYNTDNIGSRSLSKVNFITDQPDPTSGFTPNNYDFVIDLRGAQDVTLEDLDCGNVSRFIGVNADLVNNRPSGRIEMRGAITGQPMRRGIYLAHCHDVVRIDSAHFWPYRIQHANVISWLRANFTPLRIGRVDNPQIGRFFSWGSYRACMIETDAYVNATLPGGTVSGLYAGVFDADNTNMGLLVQPSVNGATFHFDQFKVASDPNAPATTTENLIWMLNANNCNGSIDRLDGQYSNLGLVAMNGGSGNSLVIGSSRSAAIGGAEFSADAGNSLEILSVPKTSSSTPYQGGGTILSPEWRAWTPTITASSGSISSATVVMARYKRQGKTVSYTVSFTVPNNNTGTGTLLVSVPFQISQDSQGAGRQTNSPGNSLSVTHTAGTSHAGVMTYQNVYPASNGIAITITGSYEAV